MSGCSQDLEKLKTDMAGMTRTGSIPPRYEYIFICPPLYRLTPYLYVNKNPYHKFHLKDHEGFLHDLAARGRTLVTGSGDGRVRVWDVITGELKWISERRHISGLFFLVSLNPVAVLTSRPHLVEGVVLDLKRNTVCSRDAAKEGTVHVWDLNTGTKRFTLPVYSEVGLLGLSGSYLVSVSPDSTLYVWDPDTCELKRTLATHTGEVKRTLAAHARSAYCFLRGESKVLSSSHGAVKMWDLNDGSVFCDIPLTENAGISPGSGWEDGYIGGRAGISRLAFEGRWCVAVNSKRGSTVMDVWDFGTEVIKNEDGTEELRDVSDRIVEPSNRFSDDTTDDEYEEEDTVTTDEGSLEIAPSSRDPGERMN